MNTRLTGISADGGDTDHYNSLCSVSVVDRYKREGNYLDSYVLPVFYASAINYFPECGLVILQPGTGAILVFDIQQAWSDIDRAIVILISAKALLIFPWRGVHYFSMFTVCEHGTHLNTRTRCSAE